MQCNAMQCDVMGCDAYALAHVSVCMHIYDHISCELLPCVLYDFLLFCFCLHCASVVQEQLKGENITLMKILICDLLSF